MITFGVFGIDNDALNTAVNVLILVLIVVWAALVFWTFADARRRIDDPMLVGCATLASLFPFVGTIVYTIVRPPEYLDDVRLRELEMQAAEARLVQLDYELCPHCEYEVKADYLRCPSCMRRLKERCHSCGKAVDPAWRLCPYCEAETGATPQTARLDDVRGRGVRGTAALLVLTLNNERRETPDGPDPDPGEAGRLRTQPHRRDHRPLRAQGPADRRAAPHDARPRHR